MVMLTLHLAPTLGVRFWARDDLVHCEAPPSAPREAFTIGARGEKPALSRGREGLVSERTPRCGHVGCE